MTGRRTAAAFDRSDPMPDYRLPRPARAARR